MFYDDGWRPYINWVFVLREIILSINYTAFRESNSHEYFPVNATFTRNRSHARFRLRKEAITYACDGKSTLSDRDGRGHYILRSF